VEGVRIAIIAVGCALATALPVRLGASPSVEVVAPRKSSQKVQLVLHGDGGTQKGVSVEVYRYTLGSGEEAKPLISLTSDDAGEVTPLALPPGSYHLVALAEHNLRADLYLDVSRKLGKQMSSFVMNLVESQYPTAEQLWEAAERAPIKDRLESFSGTVLDPSGTKVSGVAIDVVRKGTEGKGRVAQLASGPDGRFSAALADGAYIARFCTQGFQTAFVPFEVTKQGSEQLQVTLQLGRATEVVTVSSR
jgi:hypothetical protein